MAHPADIPPVIGTPRRSFAPAAFFALVLLAIVVTGVTANMRIPFPRCSFKALTGWPCAFCGGTRSLRAIANFEWMEAFWWNPLVTIAALLSFLGFLLWAVLPRPTTDRWLATAKRLPLFYLGVGAILLNWIFLLIFLPR